MAAKDSGVAVSPKMTEDHNRGHRQRDEKTEQALDYK
jgi:hypothetical protein